MNSIDAFWEIPGFWQMTGALLAFAAAATLSIMLGPTEAPFDDADTDDEL